MTGGLWIASYIVIIVGVVVALSVSLASVREVGRLQEMVAFLNTRGTEASRSNPHVGVRVGDRFLEGTELSDLRGEVIDTDSWERILLLQVVVTDKRDVHVFRLLEAVVPQDLMGNTIVSAVGLNEYLWKIQDSVAPARVSHDAQLEIDLRIGSRDRPYAIYMYRGSVLGARAFDEPGDLRPFIEDCRGSEYRVDLAAAASGDALVHPSPHSDTEGVSSFVAPGD